MQSREKIHALVRRKSAIGQKRIVEIRARSAPVDQKMPARSRMARGAHRREPGTGRKSAAVDGMLFAAVRWPAYCMILCIHF
jgi:hypothetical protein